MNKNGLLLIFGNDRLSKRLINEIPNKYNYLLAFDVSSNLKRIAKIIINKRISLLTIIKMFFAEIRRKKYKVSKEFLLVRNNHDIKKIINAYKIKKIILFRVSIIINEMVFNPKLTIINTHCAKLPEYAGLGALDKALRNNDLEQEATFHLVEKIIDSGTKLKIKKYKLNKKLSYKENENIAYETGFNLILDYLRINN